MKIKVDQDKCSGCHLCEMICSLYHLGVINIEKSAIRIEKDDLSTSLNTPLICRQCREMKCLVGENRGGDLENKKFIWDKSRVDKCPFKGLNYLGENAYHCDLCGGNPMCIKVCTTGAITLKNET